MTNIDSRKRNDILLFALAIVVLAAGLFRLLYNSVVPENSIPARAPQASIVFTQWWEDDLEENILLDLVEEFESLHEGIKVDLAYKSYEDLRLMLFDTSRDEFHGDVLAIDSLWAAELKDMGGIENVSPPLLSFISVLYYNIDILLNAGFSRPPKSWGEFINYSRTVAAMGGNRRGLAMSEGSSRRVYDDVYPWIWSGGARLINDGRPAVNTTPIIESLSLLASLNREGLVVQGNKLEDFGFGKAAFMISSVRDVKYVRAFMGDESFDISTVPVPDNYAGRSFYGNTEWAIGINPDSAHKEEARLFVDFLVEKSHFLAENAGATSALTGYAPFYSKAFEIAMAWEPATDFSGLPWMELEKVFSEELSSLFTGTSTPNGTASAIQRRWVDRLLP